ncbi:MAG TPA: hypothetical protein VKY85_14070 [Candidatus Angelobacter sp.]|nr:hypothetical protein [Candidatus Angelobacter sp.]
MKKDSAGPKFKPPYRVLLGIGIASVAFAMPAHASVPTPGCSDVAPAPNVANFSSVEVSRELAFLRRIDLHQSLGFANSSLLADATCTGSCGSDGSAHYSQAAGCTYNQTCGGNPKALQG